MLVRGTWQVMLATLLQRCSSLVKVIQYRVHLSPSPHSPRPHPELVTSHPVTVYWVYPSSGPVLPSLGSQLCIASRDHHSRNLNISKSFWNVCQQGIRLRQPALARPGPPGLLYSNYVTRAGRWASSDWSLRLSVGPWLAEPWLWLARPSSSPRQLSHHSPGPGCPAQLCAAWL